MKIFISLIVLFILGHGSMQAQSASLKIAIHTEDPSQEMVGNAFLLSKQDSSLVDAKVFFSGFVEFKDWKQSHLLKITAIGFQDSYLDLTHVESSDTIKISMENSMLIEEIEISARQAFIEKRGTDLVVNVSKSPLAQAGSAIDVLRLSPKVILNSSNDLTVIGKGRAIVYLNGRRVESQVLQTIPSQTIKTIEIIENPSAAFDAEGSAVINIITNSSKFKGYQIRTTQELGRGRFNRAYASLAATINTEKSNFDISYGYRPWKFKARNYYTRNYEDESSSIEIDNKYIFTRDIDAYDFSLSSSTNLSSRMQIGASYTGSLSSSDKASVNTNQFLQDGTKVFDILTTIAGKLNQGNHNIAGFAEYKLDSLNGKLSISGQYTNYNLNRVEHIDQLTSRPYSSNQVYRLSDNLSNIDLISGQLDFEKIVPFSLKLETGLKMAKISNKSSLNFMEKDQDNEFQNLPYLSTKFQYDEQIFAAYSSLSRTIGDFDISVGLRAESTIQTGEEESDNPDLSFEKEYYKLFPGISIQKKLGESSSITANYNQRIRRPSFQDLNPFRFYVDSLVSFIGNPSLLPEISHNAQVSWSHKSWRFNLDYNYVANPINTIISLQDPNAPATFDFVRENIVATNSYTAGFSYPIQKGKYSSYNLLSLRYEDHRYEDLQQIVSNSSTGIYLYTSQNLSLNHGFSINANYSFTSARVDGIYLDQSISVFGFSIQKSLLNNRLMATFLFNDVFDGYQFRGSSSVYGNKWTYLAAGDYQYGKLNLSWNFGKSSIKNARKVNVSKEERSRIKSQ